MKIKSTKRLAARSQARAFTLIEVVVGMGIMGFVFLSLYAGLASGVIMTQMTREHMRATQILLEKAETFRLYSWDQITTKDWVPKNFTTYYSPTTSGTNQGVTYSGKIELSKPSISTNYKDEMRQVDLTLTWKSGTINRSRTLTIFVAQNGIQNYVY